MLHHFLIDVGVVFLNNSIPLLSGYVELKLGTWIPLGLHLDQSNKKGGPVKPSADNSINTLSSYFANNPISVVSSYMQALLTLGNSNTEYKHLDSSWIASGSVQLYGLGVEAQCI